MTRRDLLRLALPSMAFAVLTNAYRSVDQYWIQGVSTQAQAAIGSCTFVLIFFFALFSLVAGGTGPLVARATGAGDEERRREVLGASLVGCVWLTLLCGLAGALGAPLIAWTLGLEGETRIEAVRYLRTLCVTMAPLVITPVVDRAFISMGTARTPMVLHALSLALNIVLTPLLIYTAGLGIVGAALASNGSRAVSTGLGLWLLLRVTRVRWRHIRPGEELRRVMRIGFPVCANIAAYALVYWAMLKTSISPLGPHVNAALGIGFSALEGFTWPCFHGVALAVGSFVGRGLGAGRPDHAWEAIRKALPFSVLLGLAAAAAFGLGGPHLTALFTEDPQVWEAATTYAVILAWSQLLVALEALMVGVLTGAGDTRTAFWVSVPFNALRIPLAWLLAFPVGLGAAGIWWAINITSLLKVIAQGTAVLRGGWARLQV